MNKKNTKNKCNTVTYLDNNGTTLISTQSKKTYIEWLSCYNASTSSKIAKSAKELLIKAQDSILSHCGVSTATHTALFNSGGSESNCFIIRSCVKAYKKKLSDSGSSVLPHIILSAIEHNASIECVKDLLNCGEIEVSYIQPTIYGNILPEDVDIEIKPNTCLISIMYANNEIPVINNIKEISIIAHKHKIPIHSDAVQVFGKYKINVKHDEIDAMSASAHKFYGPKGIGVLILNNDLINGYGLTAEVNGSQQNGLRGGTENIPGIASLMSALKYAFIKRAEKNKHLYKLRQRLLDKTAKYFKFVDYTEYIYSEKERKGKKPYVRSDLELISLGPPDNKKSFILPNTVLLAVCKNRGKPFCNVQLKKDLDKRGFVVSIGSACNTKSTKSSHVMDAIGAPPVVKRGVIRISFGDNNTMKEVDNFVTALKASILNQCKDLEE